MGNRKHRTVLLQMISLLLQAVFVDSDDISCNATAVLAGQLTYVNCDFGRDINASKTDFTVWKYPLCDENSDSQDREDVVGCSWGKGGILICSVDEGYKFNNKVSSTVAVAIPSASEENEGVYKCQLVLPESIPITTCEFRLLHPDACGDHPLVLAICRLTNWDKFVLVITPICVLIAACAVVVVCSVGVFRSRRRKVFWRKKATKLEMAKGGLEEEFNDVSQRVQDLEEQLKIPDTVETGMNTTLVTHERGSNTDPNFTPGLSVGSSGYLGSNASLASTRPQQLNPRNKQFKGSVTESRYTPPTVMHQPGFDEKEEDMDVNRGLLPQDGDNMQYTPGPDDDGLGEDKPLPAEENGNKGENEKKSGKKRSRFPSLRKSKTNKD